MMGAAIVIALFMVGLTGFTHYLVLHSTHRWLGSRTWASGTKLIVGLYAVVLAHVAEAALYAVAFIAGSNAGLGDFRPDRHMTAMDTLYFSLVNYT